MRLIDADAVEFKVEYGYDNKGVLLVPYRDIKKSIAAAKTVDAVPVVRCRDCIYTRKVYGRLVCKYGTCAGCILRDDFFCANGERRGGGEDG